MRRLLAAVAAAVVALGVLAGCGDADGSTPGDQPSSSTTEDGGYGY
ncbi:MAG: hypothetical protein ACRDV1_16195 [Actinomycetes bacterium]